MYRNMQSVDKILYNLDCLICDNNKSLRDLIHINEESGYDKYQEKVIIKLNNKEVVIEDGILFKLSKFYYMLTCLENGDFESDLEMLNCFLRKYEFKFDYQDLSEQVKNIIPIRKEYGVYTKEDDIIVQEIKYYFIGIHYLLEDLDNL
jgi:hypothetical protein|nr:MAG TPA: hypothetical protein [Caudoviricetes sp.]